MKELFKLRGTLTGKTNTTFNIVGLIFMIAGWYVVCQMNLVPSSLLPSPLKVIVSLKELYVDNDVLFHSWYSIKLNTIGYIQATILSVFLGLIIGLIPVLKSSFNKYIGALRFIPLAACTGVFISWYGIGDAMKIQFLSFAILVYLLPVVIQRIEEVNPVYEYTAYTLGAKSWQMLETVYIPDVLSRVFDDIRVLVAISWTYITIAEAVNMTQGIGALALKCARRGRIDKVFAVLLIIIVIGVVQDKLLKLLDRWLFPHKYA